MVTQKTILEEIKYCPIETAFKHIGKKWSVNILRDIFMGSKKFRDFLEKNPNLSTKMLSQRLKELEMDGIIEKIIVSKTPIRVEYKLTDKGKGLDKVLSELAMFSFKHYSEEVFDKPLKVDLRACSLLVGKSFKIK